MVAVPNDTGTTTPEVVTTPATEALVLLQLPPVVLLASVVAEPIHTIEEPVIAAGEELTTIGNIAEQPEGIV